MSEDARKLSPVSDIARRERDLQKYRKISKMLHKGSRCWAEIKILSYLFTHGNTREDDLATYTIRTLNKSANNVKKILNRMVNEKKIRRIVHEKLEPPTVYFAEGDIAAYDWDLWMTAGIAQDGDIERYRKAIKNELRKVLKNKSQQQDS